MRNHRGNFALLAGALGLAAWAAASDTLGDPRPSQPEEDLRREKDDAKAQREAWPADPETRQQRRARERRQRKGKA